MKTKKPFFAKDGEGILVIVDLSLMAPNESSHALVVGGASRRGAFMRIT